MCSFGLDKVNYIIFEIEVLVSDFRLTLQDFVDADCAHETLNRPIVC
jgi:hypothetical protein